MRKKRSAEEEASLLHLKISKRLTFGAKDARKIAYFLKNIDRHECFREVLRCVYLWLSNGRQIPLAKNEIEILAFLRKNERFLGLPKMKKTLALTDE